jgi:FRG domain
LQHLGAPTRLLGWTYSPYVAAKFPVEAGAKLRNLVPNLPLGQSSCNERLIIQQGVFLCPGNISVTFVDNLKAMSGWDQEQNIVKLNFKMGPDQVREFVMTLGSMNVNSAVLFSWCQRRSNGA